MSSAMIAGYSVPEKYWLAKLAPTMPPNARTDPTDRSIPPVRITNVIPMARSPFTEVCRSTFSRLRTFRKMG